IPDQPSPENIQTMKSIARTASIALLILLPVCLFSQGFGLIGKKAVTINRLLPPSVNLKGKRIRVEATAAALQNTSAQVQALLRTKLVTLIQKDPRFILSETNPQTVLKFTVTNVYIDQYTTGSGA